MRELCADRLADLTDRSIYFFCPVCYIFRPNWIQFFTEDVHRHLWWIVSFVKIEPVKATL